MGITQLLRPEAVRLVGSFSSKKRLFQALGEIAASVYGVDAARAVEALQERESLGPTGVGHGIALPHARLQELDDVHGIFLRCEKPLAFDAVDRQPVDLVFALLAPAGSGVDHLKALAIVSRTLRDPGLCATLRSNDDPATLHTLLTDPPRYRAAS